MIRALEVGNDAAGYPIVSWWEARSIFAPGGPGVVRVECRITKDAEGLLLFTARGATPHGCFERAKPLSKLTGFSRHAAAELYHLPSDRQAHDALAGKSQAARSALHDHGRVIFAEFGGDEPIHLNYAEASGSDLEQLEVALVQAFGEHRRLTTMLSPALYCWPPDDDRVVSHDPSSRGWNDRKWFKGVVEWGVACGVSAGGVLGFLWVWAYYL